MGGQESKRAGFREIRSAVVHPQATKAGTARIKTARRFMGSEWGCCRIT
jgi:hypothetical protein